MLIMKPIKKIYTVRIGNDDSTSNNYEMEVDLKTNNRTYSTKVPGEVNDSWEWVKVPVESPDMIKNIETLVEHDAHVIGIDLMFPDGSYAMHLRNAYPDRVHVCTKEGDELLYNIAYREQPQPDSDTPEHDLLWSLSWDHIALSWIDEHGVLISCEDSYCTV